SVIHFHYSAFLIISTALFGYGFTGVYLSISKRFQKGPPPNAFSIYSLAFGITTVLAYRLILLIPLRINDVASNATQAGYLLAVYLLLSVPFFFSGLIIGLLLTS